MSQQMQKVFKAPINTSISKSIYSFPKSSRFDKTTESTCKRPFYNLQKTLKEARATSFGFGDKSSILNKLAGPPPGTYDPDSVFTRNIEKRRGFSFGHHKRVTFDTANEFQNPGPGKYDRVMGNDSKISFSIRSKYEDPMLRHASTVGPGQYQAPKMLNSTGNYFNSRFKNSGCGKIGNAARFEDERTLPPGPGKYRDRLSMNRTGTYFNARVPSNLVMTFQGTVRPPINPHNDVPGPGSYYVFNSFQAKPMP